MALRDKTGIIATKGGGTQEDIKAESVLFTPTDDIKSTDVQSAIEEVNTNIDATKEELQDVADDLTDHTDSTIDSEIGIHGLRYFDSKLQAFIGNTWIDVVSSKSQFYAIISVNISDDALIGHTIDIIHNEETVDSKSITALGDYEFFVDNTGSYLARVTVEETIYDSEAVEIILDDIFAKNTKNLKVAVPATLIVGNTYQLPVGILYLDVIEIKGNCAVMGVGPTLFDKSDYWTYRSYWTYKSDNMSTGGGVIWNYYGKTQSSVSIPEGADLSEKVPYFSAVINMNLLRPIEYLEDDVIGDGIYGASKDMLGITNPEGGSTSYQKISGSGIYWDKVYSLATTLQPKYGDGRTPAYIELTSVGLATSSKKCSWAIQVASATEYKAGNTLDQNYTTTRTFPYFLFNVDLRKIKVVGSSIVAR